jgi:quercetin 2,3-dioxygenase
MDQRAAPYVLARDEARSHHGSFPSILAATADTGGLLTVSTGVLGPRIAGPPLHIHEEMDECFYIVEGRLMIQIGDERHDLGPGSFAWLPRQFPHTYANVSDHPVRAVAVSVPSGIEEFFEAQGAYFAQLQGPPDPERLLAIWSGHASRFVGPPIEIGAAHGTVSALPPSG